MHSGKAGVKKRRKKKKGRPKADEETGSLTADSEPADAGCVEDLGGAAEPNQAHPAGSRPAADAADVPAGTAAVLEPARELTEEQHGKMAKAKGQAAAERARQQQQRPPSENGHHRLPEAATGAASILKLSSSVGYSPKFFLDYACTPRVLRLRRN